MKKQNAKSSLLYHSTVYVQIDGNILIDGGVSNSVVWERASIEFLMATDLFRSGGSRGGGGGGGGGCKPPLSDPQ